MYFPMFIATLTTYPLIGAFTSRSGWMPSEAVFRIHAQKRKLCGGSILTAFHRKIIRFALLELLLRSRLFGREILLPFVFHTQIFCLCVAVQVSLLEGDKLRILQSGDYRILGNVLSGSKEVFLITPPIVSATVACRWGGRTIRPLNET